TWQSKRKVAASTQTQALSALLFLYRNVLKQPLDWLNEIERAKRPSRLPVVFSRAEAHAVLTQLDGSLWLMASLLYGSGLRLMECLRLRIKDVHFELNQIIVRDGKGGRDRVTVLPESVKAPMHRHLAKVKALHKRTSMKGSATSTCLMPWRRSTGMPVESGAGNMSFRRRNA